jgi:hypothetical protein
MLVGKFTAEERSLLAQVDCMLDVPADTKPNIVAKLYASAKRLIQQLRSIAPMLEARGLTLRAPRESVRSIIADAPKGACLESIAHWRKMGYGPDARNALHLAEVTQRLAHKPAVVIPRYVERDHSLAAVLRAELGRK